MWILTGRQLSSIWLAPRGVDTLLWYPYNLLIPSMDLMSSL